MTERAPLLTTTFDIPVLDPKGGIGPVVENDHYTLVMAGRGKRFSMALLGEAPDMTAMQGKTVRITITIED